LAVVLDPGSVCFSVIDSGRMKSIGSSFRGRKCRPFHH
jgi:hypothetical protein